MDLRNSNQKLHTDGQDEDMDQIRKRLREIQNEKRRLKTQLDVLLEHNLQVPIVKKITDSIIRQRLCNASYISLLENLIINHEARTNKTHQEIHHPNKITHEPANQEE